MENQITHSIFKNRYREIPESYNYYLKNMISMIFNRKTNH